MFYAKNKKPVLHWLFLYFCFLVLVSCDQDKELVDNDAKIKIITLSPHLAELVASAGALDNLVGVVSYSDFPHAVSTIQNIGDAFKLDYETILALKPNYVLSWKGGTPIAVIEKLKSLNLTIVETEINKLEDIPKVIAQIAQLTNTAKIGDKNILNFKNRLNKIQNNDYQAKTAFIETYHQPLYTVSGKHWMSEAVSICGYNNIFNDLSQISAPITLESVININPQAIITIANEPDRQWQKWQNLSAVKNQQITTISPDVFSRPTLRLLQGIEQLCQNQSYHESESRTFNSAD